MTYRIATMDCNGNWDFFPHAEATFDADSVETANDYAQAFCDEHAPDFSADWYVVDSEGQNANAPTA